MKYCKKAKNNNQCPQKLNIDNKYNTNIMIQHLCHDENDITI